MRSVRPSFAACCAVLMALASCRIEVNKPESPPLDDESRFPTPPSPASPPPASHARLDTAAPAPACEARAVEPWKELLIVDPAIIGGARARNQDAAAPWSFRAHMEALAAPSDASAFAHDWLTGWRDAKTLPVSAAQDADRVPVPARRLVHDVLLCPWLKLTPANQCDAGCGSCAGYTLDLSRAPFRLLAIVNRPDLVAPSESCGARGGEVRFVYTAVQPGTEAPLPFTVIFEYEMIDGSGQWDARGLAHALHGLGAFTTAETHAAALEAFTRRVVRKATLARVRTNESAFAEGVPPAERPRAPWEMREFVLRAETGRTVLSGVAVRHTPRLALNETPALFEWVATHEAAIIEHEDNQLPLDMQAGTAIVPSPAFEWTAPGAPPAMRAFNLNTCSGCHGAVSGANFQHIAPAGGLAAYGGGAPSLLPAQVSRFLHDPSGPDEIERRAAALVALACGSCARSVGPAPRPGPYPDAGVAPVDARAEAGAPDAAPAPVLPTSPATVDAGPAAAYHPRPID